MNNGTTITVSFTRDESLVPVVTVKEPDVEPAVETARIAKVRRKALGFDMLFKEITNLTISHAFDGTMAERATVRWKNNAWKDQVMQWVERGSKPM